MLQPALQARLPRQARSQIRAGRLEDLDGDIAPELDIAAPEHDAHPTAADLRRGDEPLAREPDFAGRLRRRVRRDRFGVAALVVIHDASILGCSASRNARASGFGRGPRILDVARLRPGWRSPSPPVHGDATAEPLRRVCCRAVGERAPGGTGVAMRLPQLAIGGSHASRRTRARHVHHRLRVHAARPAQLEVTSPQRSAILEQADGMLTVTGRAQPNASGAAIASVAVNGTKAAVAGDGSFTATIHVPPGGHLIQTTATDADGGVAVDTRAVAAGQRIQSGSAIPRALGVQLAPSMFDRIAKAATQKIKTADLTTLISASEPDRRCQHRRRGCLGATADVDTVTITDADVTLVPVTGGRPADRRDPAAAGDHRPHELLGDVQPGHGALHDARRSRDGARHARVRDGLHRRARARARPAAVRDAQPPGHDEQRDPERGPRHPADGEDHRRGHADRHEHVRQPDDPGRARRSSSSPTSWTSSARRSPSRGRRARSCSPRRAAR